MFLLSTQAGPQETTGAIAAIVAMRSNDSDSESNVSDNESNDTDNER